MMILFNVLTVNGTAPLNVRRLSSSCKRVALIFFTIIVILSTPPNYGSTMTNILERYYGTRALRHFKKTIDVEDLKNS